ncbi:hypothetical protein [Enhygromyxa salina]|uniref:Uncharacterized protein n=1 Tax=Enhygromyxa salina TaxID=215803 RepID=A0A2S9YR39_9BACT|nr:hypothetical protein [Enhygromyxa salina]PRQ07546.1 hypothetical protein ENSA7_27660 [Enhygromyxa salina]
MSAERFLITGGFFDGGSEGFVGELVLSHADERMDLEFEPRLIREPPDPSLRVANKGFTGGSYHDGLLWLCSANQVMGVSLDDLRLVRVIDDPGFNDLHHVLAEDRGLTVVNTGLESLDEFDHHGQLRHRRLLTSDARTQARLARAPEFRTCDSHPHFMHANHCARRGDGALMLTLVRQRRIVCVGDEDTDWDWASPEYSAPPHEGFIARHPSGRSCLWVTTVPGEVIACDPTTGEIIERWSLVERGAAQGWTRGLCVLEHGLLVGTTRIRPSNADYFSRWSDGAAQVSRSAISYVPFDAERATVIVDVMHERAAKVFSILPWPG